MKRARLLAIGASALVSVLWFMPSALAQCGGFRPSLAQPAGWHPQFGQPRLLRAALVELPGEPERDRGTAPIVGFWHVKFISNGVSSGIPGGVPAGAPVDVGYSQWHSDGTEIMNWGGRAPSTGVSASAFGDRWGSAITS